MLINEKLIFIVGYSRSGTTLLASTLNRHSDIVIPPETHFFDRFMPYKTTEEDTVIEDVDKTIQKLLSSSRIDDLNLNPEVFKSELRKCTENNYKSLFYALLKAYASGTKKKILGEKTPIHLMYVPLLMKWYPNAKVICIVRDPRDTVLSLLNVPWTHKNVYRHAAEWNYHYKLAKEYNIQFKKQFSVIRFEDLIVKPEEVLETIATFVGFKYEPSMLNPVDTDTTEQQDVVPNWEKSWKAQAKQKFDTSKLSVWKNSNKYKDIKIIEAICNDGMQFWEYESHDTKNIQSRILHLFFASPLYILYRKLAIIYRKNLKHRKLFYDQKSKQG